MGSLAPSRSRPRSGREQRWTVAPSTRPLNPATRRGVAEYVSGADVQGRRMSRIRCDRATPPPRREPRVLHPRPMKGHRRARAHRSAQRDHRKNDAAADGSEDGLPAGSAAVAVGPRRAYDATVPKAREVYEGKNTFGVNDPCPACGKRPCTKQVCRRCNETGCGYCMGNRCPSCASGDVHNLTFADCK